MIGCYLGGCEIVMREAVGDLVGYGEPTISAFDNDKVSIMLFEDYNYLPTRRFYQNKPYVHKRRNQGNIVL